MLHRELIIDCFAGGGGASEGIHIALGRSPDYAINHDEQALAMHAINHPNTVHLSKNIFHVDPMDVVQRRPVGVLWASPDCKHFSRAKGGKPLKRHIRDLAWSVVLWAKRARPRVIFLENVPEFREWGPLTIEGRPCPTRKGQTFKKWKSELRRLGYKIEIKEIRACDFGAPTIRKRLFIIARRDGEKIIWPKPTHAPKLAPSTLKGITERYLTAGHDVVDYSIICPSIFATKQQVKEQYGLIVKRPLVDATLSRIAKGLYRYVINCDNPFIVTQELMEKSLQRSLSPFITYGQHGGNNRSAADPIHTITASPKDQNALVAPQLVKFDNSKAVAAFMAKHNTGAVGSSMNEPVHTIVGNGHGKNEGGATPMGVVAASMISLRGSNRRNADIDAPLHTVSAGGTHAALVSTHISRQFGQGIGSDMESPIGTITAGGAGKASLVAAFLSKYNGTFQNSQISEPAHSETTRERLSLVTVQVNGETYIVEDIGMRMLTPRERFRAQGFRESYEIEHGLKSDGKIISLNQSAQGRMCGNSVPPPVVAALISANVPELVEIKEAA